MARERTRVRPSPQRPQPREPVAPEIDFLIVADAAEAVGGKLYMLGGGFDRLFVPNINEPSSVSFAVALGITVPWTAANEFHHATIRLSTEDGHALEPQVQVAFNVGRPSMANQGQSFRAIVAVRVNFKLPTGGAYVLEANMPGSQSKRTVFYASSQDGTPPGLPPGFLPG
jgi:hypothetical protein